jgi:hypothetical protein
LWVWAAKRTKAGAGTVIITNSRRHFPYRSTAACRLRNRRQCSQPPRPKIRQQRHQHLQEAQDRFLYRAAKPLARTPRSHRRTHLLQRVLQIGGGGGGGVSHQGAFHLLTLFTFIERNGNRIK